MPKRNLLPLRSPACRRRRAVWLLALLAPWSHPASLAQAAPSATPNIIFILTDDLGYGDLGCYGQRRIKTPNLNRMAAEGLRFTDAYAGATVCAPSRCVLMTGRSVGRARIRGNVQAASPQAGLRDEDVTLAEVLKNAGYATGLIGKWGLGEQTNNQAGLPRRQGFDYFFGYLRHGHAHNYYTDHLWRNESRENLPNVISHDPAHANNVATKKVVYSHDLLAQEGLDFVRQRHEKPFFLYWALTIPHANNEAGDQGMEVPDLGPYAELDWPLPQKAHAAMISRMDGDVGRMFDLLDELGIADNTLVIFTSDNGPHREGGVDADFNDSNGPLRGYKGNVTEGGIRVPMIARWPGHIAAGTTSDSPVTFADMLPTLANVAGAAPPQDIDGLDVSPTLAGRMQPELADRFLYWEFYKDRVVAQSARWKHWKAVREPVSSSIALYNLKTDLGETTDVSDENPDVVARFKKFFSAARTETPAWPFAGRGAQKKAAQTLPASPHRSTLSRAASPPGGAS